MALVKVTEVPKRKRSGGGPGREPRLLDIAKEIVEAGELGQWYEIEVHEAEHASRATTARTSLKNSAERLKLADEGLDIESTTRTGENGEVTVYAALVEYVEPSEDEASEDESEDDEDEFEDDEFEDEDEDEFEDE